MHEKLGGFLQGQETIDAFREGAFAGEERPTWGMIKEMECEVRERGADLEFRQAQAAELRAAEEKAKGRRG